MALEAPFEWIVIVLVIWAIVWSIGSSLRRVIILTDSGIGIRDHLSWASLDTPAIIGLPVARSTHLTLVSRILALGTALITENASLFFQVCEVSIWALTQTTFIHVGVPLCVTHDTRLKSGVLTLFAPKVAETALGIEGPYGTIAETLVRHGLTGKLEVTAEGAVSLLIRHASRIRNVATNNRGLDGTIPVKVLVDSKASHHTLQVHGWNDQICRTLYVRSLEGGYDREVIIHP
jgi:hypothetical protein